MADDDDINFAVPYSFDELSGEASDDGPYRVEMAYGPEEVTNLLPEMFADLEQYGPHFICRHFDVVYGALK